MSGVRIEKVVRLYNAVISTIVGGSTSWSLENGYRNILATIGITEDGKLRNIIGQEAEQGLKDKISAWLNSESSIACQESGAGSSSWLLGRNREVRMSYSSELDIWFEKAQESGRKRTRETISVIEVKGGTDPAGALERLGAAMKKTFDRTPARSKNFLVAGIVTDEMYRQMSSMHMEDHFILWDVMHDNEKWDGFISEIFHHTLRLLLGPYHSAKPHSTDI